MDVREWLQWVALWFRAISNPGQFLGAPFVPTEQQFMDGVQFAVGTATVSYLLYTRVIFQGVDGSDRFGRAINGLLGTLVYFVTVSAYFLPFWLLGGKGTIGANVLAYAYTTGPYLPLMACVQLIVVWGMPVRLRRYALYPGTAAGAGSIAAQSPDSDMKLMVLGLLLSLGLTGC